MNMNWDNQTVIKFLKLYKKNSCIWDPKNISSKCRSQVYVAWTDIRDNMGIVCTVKDLKRKKESLMATYRRYKIRIKRLERRGEVYQPPWFAFPYMDSFLNTVYGCTNVKKSEDEEAVSEPQEAANTTMTIRPEPINSRSTLSPRIKRRPIRNPLDLQTFSHTKHQRQPYSNDMDDECNLFGKLITLKLRKLSEDRRDVMMAKINQLFVNERRDVHSNSYISPNSLAAMSHTSSPPRTFEDISSYPSTADETGNYIITKNEKNCSNDSTRKIEYVLVSNDDPETQE